MRLIPRNTKVRTSFYKGITIADVILGLVGLGLAALAVASNLPYRLFIALGIACLFIPLFIPVGEERIYKCALYLARHIFSRKKHTEKGKDAANIQSIVPYERIDGNCIVNKDGGFTGVLEIKPIEFRLLGANKQNYLIDGVLTNVLTSVGASQEAAIVKLEKPLDFDRHIQADLQRIVALAEANENGTLSNGEYAARIDVVQDRLALVDTLNTEQQVKYSCYYIAVTDRNKTSLMATLSVMRGNRHYAVNQRLCGNARNGAEINGDHQRVAILAHLPAFAQRYERFVRALRESGTDQRNRSGQYRA